MVAHRLGAEEQTSCDVGDGDSGRDEVEDLTLPCAELGELLGVESGQRSVQEGQYPAGDGRTEDRLAVTDRCDGADDLVDVGSLHEVSAGSCCPHGGKNRLVADHGQDQYPCRWSGGDDPPGCLDSVELRHVHIHDHKVRQGVRGEADRLLTVAGFPDNDGFLGRSYVACDG
jgi:hypothetical protein